MGNKLNIGIVNGFFFLLERARPFVEAALKALTYIRDSPGASRATIGEGWHTVFVRVSGRVRDVAKGTEEIFAFRP